MLKKIIVTSALVLCSTNLFALDCNNIRTSLESATCAQNDFEASDKELNALYKQLMSLQNAEYRSLTKKAQLAWIKFKEADCEVEAYPTEGGSVQPTIRLLCLKDKTDKRIAELKERVNCEKGKLNCLSVTK